MLVDGTQGMNALADAGECMGMMNNINGLLINKNNFLFVCVIVCVCVCVCVFMCLGRGDKNIRG